MVRKQKKILAVDDNPVNLEIIAESLAPHFCVKFARSGAHAIQVAKCFHPDVILLDVMMPDVDGLETCRLLRAMPSLEHCIIIMVSAKAMPSERAAGIHAGANEYITKPFDENELLATLRHYNDSFITGAGSTLVGDNADSQVVNTC